MQYPWSWQGKNNGLGFWDKDCPGGPVHEDTNRPDGMKRCRCCCWFLLVTNFRCQAGDPAVTPYLCSTACSFGLEGHKVSPVT